MKTIYKYPLVLNDEVEVYMPEGAEILHVRVQGACEDVYVWALIDLKAPMSFRRFEVYGTGHPVKDIAEHSGGRKYIGTVMLQGGSLVYHIFDLGFKGT